MSDVFTVPAEPVESTNIHAIGYDPARRILAVTFRDGHVYHYANVPEDHYHAFRSAISVGKYYHALIRGKFPSEKMTGHCALCGDLGRIGTTCLDCGCGPYTADQRKDGSR